MTERPVRIPGQPPAEWSADTRRVLDATVATGRSRPVHLPAVVAHHPSLLRPYIDWAKTIALEPTLSPRLVALICLRSAHATRSGFEWGVHADRARVAGVLSASEIGRAGAAPLDDDWSALERAALEAVDELSAEHTVRDDTWATLAGSLDDGELVELVLTVGHYSMLAMLANASGVVGEPDWPALGRAPSE